MRSIVLLLLASPIILEQLKVGTDINPILLPPPMLMVNIASAEAENINLKAHLYSSVHYHYTLLFVLFPNP
jgi:hypothetical protein